MVNIGTFDRAAPEIAFDAEHHIVAGRHFKPGPRRPAEPARTEKIPVNRCLVKIAFRPEIMFDKERRLRLAHDTDAAVAIGEPTIGDIGLKNVGQAFRGRPVERAPC